MVSVLLMMCVIDDVCGRWCRVVEGVSEGGCVVSGVGLNGYVCGESEFALGNNVLRVSVVDDGGDVIESIGDDDVEIEVEGGRVLSVVSVDVGCVEGVYSVDDGCVDDVYVRVWVLGSEVVGSPFVMKVRWPLCYELLMAVLCVQLAMFGNSVILRKVAGDIVTEFKHALTGWLGAREEDW